MSEEQSLVVIQPDEAYDVFTKPGATDPIIAQLRAFAADAPKDVSTLKARKAITTFANKFVKSKTFLESFGKEIADDVKEIPKKVDAARKLLRDDERASWAWRQLRVIAPLVVGVAVGLWQLWDWFVKHVKVTP